MRFQRQFFNWDIKQVYLLFFLCAILADLLLNGGNIALREYFGGFRQLVIEVFLVGLLVSYAIELPARNRARQEAWDVIYDFKDGTDTYSQGRVRSAFRSLLGANVRRFRFFPPKGQKSRDFTNLRIENVQIEKSQFVRIDFSRIKWFRVSFKDTLFKDVNLSRAVINRCVFKRCHFKGIDFRSIDRKRSNYLFVDCQFDDCQFDDCQSD